MTSKRMCWLLAGVCFLTFAASINYPFLGCQDDWAYVTANRHLQAGWSHIVQLATTPVLGLSTPLPQISYLVDHSIAGMEPWIYHLINILWHCGMVLLVFRLFRELGIRRNAAFFTALIFAIHPQRVESVVWISERKDVMCGFFFILSCVCYMAYRRPRRPASAVYQWGSIAAMAAALASKPSAAALPFVLLALDFHRTEKFHWKPLIGHFTVLAGYLLLSQTLLSGTGKNISNMGLRPVLGLRNYCTYFLKTFYPSEVCPLYPYINLSPADFILIGLCIAALIWFIARFRKKAVYDVLPMLFCAGIVLAPVCGIIIFSSADFADRYSYIPSVFFLAAAALILPPIPEKFRKWTFCIPVLLLIRTWLYLPAWNGDGPLLQAACSVPDYNYRGAIIYAEVLTKQGKAQEGLEILKHCGRSDPRTAREKILLDIADHLFALMARYQAGEDPAKLFPEFTKILAPDKNRDLLQRVAYLSLLTILPAHADCALAAGKPIAAADIYATLARSYPDEPFTEAFYMGVSMMLRRNAAEAVKYFERALAESPDDEPTKRNLENARRLAAGKQR